TLAGLSGGRRTGLPTVSGHGDESDARGVPFGRAGDTLDEQLEIWSRAWTGSPVVFDGRHYRFGEVWLEPQPFRPGGPPLWFGGAAGYPPPVGPLLRGGRGVPPPRPPPAPRPGPPPPPPPRPPPHAPPAGGPGGAPADPPP